MLFVMTPFSLQTEILPVQQTVMTSHSSTLFLSLSSIEESIVLDFHPLLHPPPFVYIRYFLGARLRLSPSPLLIRTRSFNVVRSSLGMTNWQINAVYLIAIKNGHSRVLFHIHLLRSHQTRFGLCSAHARLC